MDKTTVYEMLGFVLAFLGIGIGYFAIHLGIRHDKYKRELEHKERMCASSWVGACRATRPGSRRRS